MAILYAQRCTAGSEPLHRFPSTGCGATLLEMRPLLRTADDELRDMAHGSPPLVDATTGSATGVKLLRWLGAGGMATVFLAERDPRERSACISHLSPSRLVIKLNKLSTEKFLARIHLRPADLFAKELAALGRVMERKPPTEFVLGLYGSGTADVDVAGRGIQRLPWLALELIDGGAEGTTLSERVRRTRGGIDPVRALRLVRGILEGVKVLHELGVVHRDIKPDNVFTSGPIDDETPKIADFGISRVEGLISGTLPAMTTAYGAPEQLLSMFDLGRPNPLIGPWTDVHAVAALVWFIVGGEDWCRGEGDQLWHAGERRPLQTAGCLHPGFVQSERLLRALDAVLRRGAVHRLPERAWSSPGAKDYADYARNRYGHSMFDGVERFAEMGTFAAELLPILEECSRRWAAQAVKDNVAATAFRPTRFLKVDELEGGKPLANISVFLGDAIGGTDSSLLGDTIAPALPGGAVFLPNGRVLVRFGDRLLYFVGDRPHKVSVPREFQAAVDATRWVGRGPAGGFALIGPQHIILVRGGEFSTMPLPLRRSGGDLGLIEAVIADGRVFGIVTGETDDSEGGPELWTSVDGSSWSQPTVLPLGGDVHALAYGPYGFLIAGSRGGKRARALHLRLDGQATLFTQGVNDKPPLLVAVSGALRESWAAGPGVILRFDAGGAASEHAENAGTPVAMGLDLVGSPWLATERAVLRRETTATSHSWKVYYRRGSSEPPLVAIGFTPDGVRVLDSRGGGARIEPHDIDEWRSTMSTSVFLGTT